jgi:hypothetical protein
VFQVLAVLALLILIGYGVMLLSNPTPARHYDSDTGVMCYTVPGAISCVKAP